MRSVITIGFVVLITGIFTFAYSLPKFAVRDGVTCGQCHVNSQGSGLRNSYGSDYYSRQVLPMEEWGDFGSEDFTGQLNEFVRLGTDIRVQYYRYNQNGSSEHAFFPMQADAYLNIVPAERFQLFLEQSLFRNFAATDVWGQYEFDNDNGYFRLGQFLPAYGLRLEDHTAFVRGGNVGGIATPEPVANIPTDRQGLHWKPTNQTVGVEATLKPFGLEVTGSLGKPRNGTSYSTTLSVKHAFWVGDINALVGGSLYNGDAIGIGRTYSMAGIYGGINWGKFTLLGEVDVTADYAEPDATGMATYSEITYKVMDGLDVGIEHHFYDENIEFTENSLTRIGFGLDIIPVAYVEFKPQFRLVRVAADPDYAHSEVILQGHFWF
ncbi:MAG: hypothetical protein K9N46_07535 [Candidatus Marinimicrobia bacterium]|nr:hypothetical protein [Candidatus Neomarinimicrobiota bacterium]MCF7880575.1 hypothetical protein [Candidatus Neomarinimicrobiota bacterium]